MNEATVNNESCHPGTEWVMRRRRKEGQERVKGGRHHHWQSPSGV